MRPAARCRASLVRRFAAAQPGPFADAAAARCRFFPPGYRAARGRLEKFGRLVERALREGNVVEMDAIGAFAMKNALYALSPGLCATRLSVVEVSAPRGEDVEEGKQVRRLRLLGERCSAPADLVLDPALELLVNRGMDASVLARKIALEIGRGGRIVARARADSVTAVGTLLMALAALPRLGSDRTLRYVTSSSKMEGDARTMVAVCISEDLEVSDCKSFKAFPPGRDPEPGQLRRFTQSVQQRLETGHRVVMDCRGKDAVAHALAALARVQGKTADFEVHWTSGASMRAGPTSSAGSSSARVLSFRASGGQSWEDFNRINFRGSGLLKVTETTNVQALTKAIRAEVLRKGAVSVHAFADDAAALSRAAKALAAAPQGLGWRRLVCTPSLGRAKVSGAVATDFTPTLRVHARFLERANQKTVSS